MNKDNIKVFIGKSKKGIVLIVAAALLSQLLNIAQYVYTRKTEKDHQRPSGDTACRKLKDNGGDRCTECDGRRVSKHQRARQFL